ncbi:MAG: DoxX family membrane protein [Spirochaetales bacterium]|nr:DoxX family membrane protein [Spirochaetales bacterium]
MAKLAENVNSLLILRIMLAIFFIALGICGVSTRIDEDMFSMGGGTSIAVEISFGVVEIICGIVLLLGVFFLKARKYTAITSLIIFIIWIIRIVITRFFQGFTKMTTSFENFMVWLLILSVELVIGAAIFVILKRYD